MFQKTLLIYELNDCEMNKWLNLYVLIQCEMIHNWIISMVFYLCYAFFFTMGNKSIRTILFLVLLILFFLIFLNIGNYYIIILIETECN